MIIRLFFRVGLDVIISNLHVAWGVLTCGSRPPRSRFIKIPWTCATPGLAVLAMITSVTPGTVWSELALDRSILLLHVFDLDDEASFIQQFKHAYERPLMEIFE